MRTTIPKLRRIVRKVITEARYEWMNNKKGSGFPFTEEQWAATDQAEKDAYMDWAFGDDDDDMDLRGDEGEEYDEERVDRMVSFLRNSRLARKGLVRSSQDEDEVYHALRGEFPDASEEEIADAIVNS